MMKRIDDPFEAKKHALDGGQALTVYDLDRRGILQDQDRNRLQRTLVNAGLGVQYIHIREDGQPNQHVDVSGAVLDNLLRQCEPEKKPRKTVKIEKPKFDPRVTNEEGEQVFPVVDRADNDIPEGDPLEDE